MLTLHDLAPLPRWLLWRNEHDGTRARKVPYQASGRRASSTDPATWCDYETANAARPRVLNGHDGGLGIALGDLGDGLTLAGIDLDSCRDAATGERTAWAAKVIERLDTCAEVSPSQRGVKLFFTLRNDQAEAARAALGGRSKWARPGADHPEAIEVYLAGRYFTTTFQPANNAPIRTLEAADLAWLRGHAEAAFATGAGRDDSRSARAYRLAAAMKRAGKSYDDFVAALKADPDLADWWDTKGQRHGEREATRTWERAPGSDRTLVDLEIKLENLTVTARELRDRLAGRPMLFDRGGPVRLHHDATIGGLVATALRVENVCHETHACCRPVIIREEKGEELVLPVTLPDRIGRLYLALHGDHDLRPLTAIASAPALRDDGTIAAGEGYDPETGIYREKCPDLAVPVRPTRADAEAALARLRRFLRTWPLADAHRDGDGFVAAAMPPGQDESAALVALLTAVCRPSLHLAPAVLIRAPGISGAGTGKGLLARSVAAIAYGRAPYALPAGHDADELDKRLVAAAMTAEPMLLLDNLNARTLRSDTLAALITERPARLRPLGSSTLTPITMATLIVVTGNGLTLGEDLARRFVTIELDALTEDPESREFPNSPLAEAAARRAELLADALIVWRWGRQAALPAGRPLGSFEQWSRWCRDPLLALGCRDPVERVAATKADDPHRRAVTEAFQAWWEAHADRPVRAADLAEPVKAALDPRARGRQFLAMRVQRLAGTRAGGFALTADRGAGRWSATTYALARVG